jgi:polyisoprenoid-binding protein YceI
MSCDRSAIALAVALLGLAPAVQAIEFAQLQPGRSSLVFVSKQMNVPVEGRFRSFRARLSFDPEKPAAARVEFEIDLASIDAGSKEADDEVAGRDWFDTKAFPVAKFLSTSVKPLGGNRYEVSGRMTIKGRTRDLVVPVSVSRQGDSASFEGSLVVNRADYDIGGGVWADFGTVANEVQVRFRLVATAARTAAK